MGNVMEGQEGVVPRGTAKQRQAAQQGPALPFQGLSEGK